MKNILPKDEIRSFFDKDVNFEEYTLKDIEQIKELKPYTLFGMALGIWNRIVEFELFPVDPLSIADYIERKDPDTYLKMSRILGTNVIRDIYYVRGEVEDTALYNRKVLELFTAHVYPNNLHLAVIDLLRPDRPVKEDNYRDLVQNHAGLFYKVIDNAVNYGKSRGCNYLMLMAKSTYQVEIFKGFGFLKDDPLTESKAQKLGLGMPMMRHL